MNMTIFDNEHGEHTVKQAQGIKSPEGTLSFCFGFFFYYYIIIIIIISPIVALPTCNCSRKKEPGDISLQTRQWLCYYGVLCYFPLDQKLFISNPRR